MEKQRLETGSRTYRISELVEVSGVSRDMIKYYLRADLLPRPEKPRPNLSLYTENHLDLIQLIPRFQQQTNLSLPEIADVFRAAGHDANAIEIELLSDKYRTDSEDNIIPMRVNSNDTRGLTFPAEFLEELVGYSLLSQTDNLGKNESQLAGLLWAARNTGVPLEFFQAARGKLTELADLEVKTLIAIKRPGQNYHAMVKNITDADRIINRWMTTEKNSQVRNQFQQLIDNSERATATLLDTTYLPSAVFRERYGVEGMLSQMRGEFDVQLDHLQQAHELCIACLFLTEYDQTIAIADAILAVAPGDSVAIACVALAHGMQNQVDKAVEYAAQLEGCEVYHPVIRQARILVLLLQAAKQGGVTDTSELMKSAGELFLDLPNEVSTDQPETILALARANVAFPDFTNSRPQAIKALRTLLEQLKSDALEWTEVPIAGLREAMPVICRTYTLYYLGMLLDMDGNRTQARQCFEQVIQLDPASNFAQRAYLYLGSSTGESRDQNGDIT